MRNRSRDVQGIGRAVFFCRKMREIYENGVTISGDKPICQLEIQQVFRYLFLGNSALEALHKESRACLLIHLFIFLNLSVWL